ncbi:MAG: DUF58 domain-containing protein [Gemmatimonadaceae bacterium]
MLRSAAAAGAALVPYAELLDSLVGMTWGSLSRARTGEPGAHRSSRSGRSPEFTEYRAYRPGDDLRRLDWKLYGRTDRLFLRIADDHAALKTAIVVDASASMRFPVEGYGKWEQACAIALGLASIAIGDGDAVGVVVTAQGGDRAIPARRRRDVLHDVAELLHSIEVRGEVSVADTLSRVASQPRLVVITDFLGDSERALPALRVAAASGSEVVAVHVAADAELNPPARTFMAADPERPTFQRAMSATTRPGYDAAFAAWRDRVAGELHAMSATYVLTSTGEPVRDAVRRIVGGNAGLAAS